MHNIRAAYDNLVYSAVLFEGNEPTDTTGFPIYHNLKSLRARGARKIDGISSKAKRLLCALKPYRSGNPALWELHRLDVTDKHKSIVPIWARVKGVNLMSISLPGMPEEMRKAFESTEAFHNILLSSADNDPLKNGDKVFRVAKAARKSGVSSQPQIVIELAFGEDGIKGRPIIETLQEQIDFVQRVIDVFERRIFRHF